MSQSAYPLSWPSSWPRVKYTSMSSFGRRSIDTCTQEIIRQIGLLRGTQLVVSTNLRLRNDGLPVSNQAQPADTGVAIYFTLKSKPCVLACDKWYRVECNMWAIAKDIDAMRGRSRWGVGSVERAFAGYTALPAPGESGAAAWYQVLGVSANCTIDDAREAYYREAKLCHPDRPENNGSNDAMLRLNVAWDQCKADFAAR